MTLTDVDYYVRKIVPFAIFGVLFFILFYIAFRLIMSRSVTPVPSADTPIPAAPPDIYFGKLSRLNPSTSIEYPPEYTFLLDNVEGKPVTATQSARVFFLKQKPTRFGYLETAYTMAKNMKFDTALTRHILDGINVVFETDDKKAVIDIADYNFEYRVKYEQRPELFANPAIPPDSTVVENARQFLRTLLKYPTELSQGIYEIIYLKYNPETDTFVVVTDPDDANAVEVDFFRPDIDSHPVKPPRYFNSQNYVVLTYANKKAEIIKAQIKYFEKDDAHFGTYPLKSADAAYAQLTDGKGIIVSAGNNSSTVTINQMFLGYYDPDVYQEYLQPVYIFLGENGFAAYVPAVDEEYVEAP